MAVFNGTIGDDTYPGTADDDTIADGGGGNDTLNGAGGDDTVTVTGGFDTVDGDDGDDLLVVDYSGLAGSFRIINLGSGTARLTNDVDHRVDYREFERFDITTGAGNDTIDLTAGGIYTVPGIDRVSSGAGADIINTGAGAAFVDGGADFDEWRGNYSDATTDGFLDLSLGGTQAFMGGTVTGIEAVSLTMGAGDDTILTLTGAAGMGRAETLNGGAGDDVIGVGAGFDTANGGSEADLSAGDDLLVVDYSELSGSFRIINLGGGGARLTNDVNHSVSYREFERFDITTGGGTDTIDLTAAGTYTVAGFDRVSSGAGNDAINTGIGGAVIDGGDGNDTWSGDLSAATTNGVLDLSLGGTQDFLLGGSVTGIEAVKITTGSGNDTVLTLTGVAGGTLVDDLKGGAGDDTLGVGAGQDFANGGDGDDLLVVDYSELSGNFRVINLGAGAAAVTNDVNHSVIYREFERFDITTGAGTDTIDLTAGGVYTVAGFDRVSSGAGADTINTGIGGAVIDGGAGNDTWAGDLSAATTDGFLDLSLGGTQAFLLGGSVTGIEALKITTGSGDDTVLTLTGAAGGTLVDDLKGGAGNDTLGVGAGRDTADGDEGEDDLLVADYSGLTGNFRIFNVGAGAAALSNDVDHSVIYREFERFDITTGGGNDTIDLTAGGVYTAAGDDVVNAGTGTDTVNTGAGSDRLVIDYSAATDSIITTLNGDFATGYSGNYSGDGAGVGAFTVTFQGVEHFDITGGDQADFITTGDGDDNFVLNLGDDELDGGGGVDTVSYDYLDRRVAVFLDGRGPGLGIAYIDIIGQPTDERDYLTNIENVIGSAFNDTIFGDDANNRLEGGGGNDNIGGGAGDNVLLGGAGDDSLSAGSDDGLGDDIFDGGDGIDGVGFGDALGSVTIDLAITEAQDTGVHGTDTFISIENLQGTLDGDTLRGNDVANVLEGSGGDDFLYGRAGADQLFGSADGGDFDTGNDLLDGGLGADRMEGGQGDDTYYVDNLGDVVVETRGRGDDTVVSSVSFNAQVRGAEVETIILTGAARTAIGDVFDNRLVGNASQNILNGYKGADQMEGRGGDDIYVVDNVGDVVVETEGNGTDRVNSAIDYTLGEHLENLSLLGGADLSGTGNDLLNRIAGNRGDNTIIGSGGVDILSGGTGQDTFVYTLVSDSTYGGYDRIMDLDDNDTIDLTLVDANANVGGDQDFVLVDSFSRTAGEMILDDSRAGLTFLVGDTDGDGRGDFRIALIGDHGDFQNILG